MEESSGEESSLSEEEDKEPTPSPKPKRTTKKKQRLTEAKAKTKAVHSFGMDGPYKPGIKFKSEWLQGKKPAYLAARKRYHRTGTKEALTDKVDCMKTMIKRWKATGASEEKLAQLTASILKWEQR